MRVEGEGRALQKQRGRGGESRVLICRGEEGRESKMKIMRFLARGMRVASC